MPEKTFEDYLADLKKSVESALKSLGEIRAASYDKALEKAGGDKYAVEAHGFDVKKYSIISKIEDFGKIL
jgi:hypothetical protein